MRTSSDGIALIKKFEGCRLTAYKDAVGVPTIGYGHTKGVKMGTKITEEQAENLLREDIRPLEVVLNKLGINFCQNQFDALISWLFNLGTGNWQKSTLRRYVVSKKDDRVICREIVKWVNAGGKPLLGLKRRRVAEANMFFGREAFSVTQQGSIIEE